MKNPPHRIHPTWRRERARSGFTLVEILVVIIIISVLAVLLFTLIRRAKNSANSVSCLNRLKQAGALLISSASENNGRLELFRGGNGNFAFRPYFVVLEELDVPPTLSDAAKTEVMRGLFSCPGAAGTGFSHWNCYGINFTSSARADVTWQSETLKDGGGRSGNISVLRLSNAGNPADYPLVADSCTGNGAQIFRILGSDRIGLRHQGKANAAFLDGSARSLDRSELGKLGFAQAYDISSTPPELIDLSKR
ncbi:MAG: prepilin-type N-terminal cleavage/methylation domain-containing protein [Verrucomicrobiae bacterium]|nr:prepilin-type N-terminal cleavage/methylation domain-containing protein [Verrucomicrobiae bacterium]